MEILFFFKSNGFDFVRLNDQGSFSVVLNGGDPEDWRTWKKHDIMFNSHGWPLEKYLAPSMLPHVGILPHWRMNCYPFDFPEYDAWIVHAAGWAERKPVCLDWTLDKVRERDESYPEGDHRYAEKYENCCKECGPTKAPYKRPRRKKKKKKSKPFSFMSTTPTALKTSWRKSKRKDLSAWTNVQK